MTIDTLAGLPRWVGWKREPSDEGLTEELYDAARGGKASQEDPGTWNTRSIAAVWAQQHVNGQGGGIAVQLGNLGCDVGLASVRLEGCRNADGELQPWALQVLRRLGTYAEFGAISTEAQALFLYRLQPATRHYVLRHAPGVRNSASKLAQGIDVRGEGGYVIWPGSPGYTVISDAPLAEWPDWLLALVLGRPVKNEEGPEKIPISYVSAPGIPKRIGGYVSTYDHAFSVVGNGAGLALRFKHHAVDVTGKKVPGAPDALRLLAQGDIDWLIRGAGSSTACRKSSTNTGHRQEAVNDGADPQADTETQPRLFRCLFGTYTQASWTDQRVLAWPELADILTAHRVGPKAGTCVVPAVFRGDRRHKAEADQIDVAFLDSDSGATLAEIEAGVRAQGWAAVISSTHSHLVDITEAKREHWLQHSNRDAAAFLVAKGMLPHVAAGAVVESVDGEHVRFRHAPCPKFRVVLPLYRPWRAVDYPTQDQANAAWAERIDALAHALGLQHDQACRDTSRLFYLPRWPGKGPLPETCIIEGSLCDTFTLPPAASAEPLFSDRACLGANAANGAANPTGHEYVDPYTGEVVDLVGWAREHGDRFLVAKALGARRPSAFTGRIVDRVKVHIECPNAAAHTQARQDGATFVTDAGKGHNRGFVIHCRHAHCDGTDRLFFLRQMLEQRWLGIGDLTDPNFLTAKTGTRGASAGVGQASQQTAGTAKPGLRVHTLGELLDDITPMPDDLIAPRLLTPGGMLALGGAPKVGKSDLLIHLLVHAAGGVPFLRFMPPRAQRVFYLQAEIQYDYLRERLQGMQLDAEARAAARDNLLVTPKLRLLLDMNGVADVAAAIRMHFGNMPPDIICVDPIRNLFDGGPGGEGENSNAAMLFFLQERIETLRDEVAPECGIILCHHTRKITKAQLGEDPFMALSGASALRGFYTSGLVMYRPDEKRPERELHIELRNGPGLAPMIIDKVGGRWVELDRSGERLVRKDQASRFDAERKRKQDVILQSLYSEAIRGKLYTGLQFAEAFENRAGTRQPTHDPRADRRARHQGPPQIYPRRPGTRLFCEPVPVRLSLRRRDAVRSGHRDYFPRNRRGGDRRPPGFTEPLQVRPNRRMFACREPQRVGLRRRGGAGMTPRSLRFGADLNLHVEVPQLPQLRNFPQHIACEINGLQAMEVEGSSTWSSTPSTCQAIDMIGQNEVEELREFPPPTGVWARTSSSRPRRRRTVQTSPPVPALRAHSRLPVLIDRPLNGCGLMRSTTITEIEHAQSSLVCTRVQATATATKRHPGHTGNRAGRCTVFGVTGRTCGVHATLRRDGEAS